MEKKKVAVVALVVVFIVVISVIVITRNLGNNASTEVALMHEDVVTEETEIDLELSAEEEEVIEESEVVEEESTGEIPVAVEESEAIEEEPVVEEVKSIYTDVSYIMYAKTSLNIRQGLGADTEKIGSLTQNQEVTVIGEVADSDWVLISYSNGKEGHVNKSYLSETKVVVSKPKETNDNTSTPSESASQGTTTDSQTTQPTDNSSQTPSTSSGSSQSSTGDPLMDIILGGGDTSKGEESPIGYW